MSKSTKALCRTAVMAALYVLLNTVAIKAGNLRITFASLPVVVTALLFGPLESAAAALTGEFFNQLLMSGYGITATTPLWLIPPAIRGAAVGLAARVFRRTGRPLEDRPPLCCAVCVLAALATTAVNTAVMALDAVIFGYYTRAYVFGALVYRLISGVVIAVVITAAALPLVRLLRRQGVGRA